MAVQIWKDNTSPSLTDTIRVNGVAFDLSGSSVKLRMRLATAAPTDTLKIDTAAVVVSAAAGTVRYDWAAADVDTAGEYVGWWRVTLPSTKVQDSDEFEIGVRPHGQTSGNLCTLADVRTALEWPAAETTRNDLVLSLIPTASDMISAYVEREFAPATAAGVKRRVKVDPRTAYAGIVDFSPWDLQTATLVQLNPEEASPTTLVAGTDYALQPVQNDEGVYTSLRLSSYLNVVSQSLIRFNYALIDVTGTWGFPSVPPLINEACVETVIAWMRRDISQFGLNFQDGMQLGPELTPSFDLPVSVLRKINPYRRTAGAF